MTYPLALIFDVLKPKFSKELIPIYFFYAQVFLISIVLVLGKR